MEPHYSTGITIVSSPKSPPEKLPNDTDDDQEIFHTPLPRYRSTSNSPAFYDCNDDGMIGGGLNHDGETDNAGGKRAVDLGKEERADSAKKIKIDPNPDGTFHMESEEAMVIESHTEPLVAGPKEEITETETNSIEAGGMNGKSLDVSTECGERDTEIMKVECEDGNGEENSEKNTSIVEDIDSAGNGSISCGPEDKIMKNEVLPSLADEHPEANSRAGVEGLKQTLLSDGTMDIGLPSEPLGTGPKEGNIETEINCIEVVIKGESLDVSTESIECDTEIRKVKCEDDNGEGSPESNTNIVEDAYSAGTGSNSCGTEEKPKKNGVLPLLADEHSGDTCRARTEDFKKLTFSDVLQILAEEDPGKDKRQAHLSLWEVAEARWGPF